MIPPLTRPQQFLAGREQDVPTKPHDTVGIAAVDSNGDCGAVVSTSGMSFKHSGRVGDSPLPGQSASMSSISLDPQ